jgi:hypothetical protein
MARKLAKQNPHTHPHNLTMNENPNPIPAILPRSAWESQIAYLWAVFQTKKHWMKLNEFRTRRHESSI